MLFFFHGIPQQNYCLKSSNDFAVSLAISMTRGTKRSHWKSFALVLYIPNEILSCMHFSNRLYLYPFSVNLAEEDKQRSTKHYT